MEALRIGKPSLIGLLALFMGCANPTTSTPQCLLASYAPNPDLGKEVPIGKFKNFGGTSVAQAFMLASSTAAPGAAPSSTPSTTPSASPSYVPTYAAVMLSLVGTFSPGHHILTATLESDSGGVPDGTPISTSKSIDVSQIGTNRASYSFLFQSSVALNLNQVYWLRLRGSFPVSDTNYVNWYGADGLTNAYQVKGKLLNSLYETSVHGNYSSSQIGGLRFLLFAIGC